MSGDTLSDLLRTVRLRGAVFYYVDGSAPWVDETPPASELVPVLMPAAEHLIPFHAFAEGSGWVQLPESSPVPVSAGDVIFFPRGDAHVLSSAPGLRARAGSRDFLLRPRPPQLPHALDPNPPKGVSTLPGPCTAERTTVVCGFLALDARPFNPLLDALPQMIHLPANALGPSRWIASFMETAVSESSRKRPGGEAVLERMSEMLFVEALRCYLDSLPPAETGWLAGLRDPIVGRALSLLHEKPSEPWTLERLGAAAGASRSTFAERFAHLIGEPPMQYLTRWRMQLAARLLRDTDAKVLDVALDAGYESEAAFSRAFKRVAGVSPRAWRRAGR